MFCIRLFHWNSTEAEEKAERIRSAEYAVDGTQISPNTLKELRTDPPDAIVIDLERLPA